MRGLNWLSRLTAHIFVKPSLQGAAFLQARPGRLFIIESDRASHRYLLLSQLRKNSNSIPLQEILSASHSQRDSLLNRLEAHIQTLDFLPPDQDIEVVPVSIYHGRMPQRESSIFNLLGAETWHKAGILGRCLQLIINGGQTLIQIDSPLSLRQLQQESQHQPPGVIAHKAARIFHSHFRRRRQAIIGPDLSQPSTLIRLILKNPDVQAAVTEAAQQTQRPRSEVEKQAARQIKRIAANINPTLARAFVPLLRSVWQRIYKRVHVLGIERVQTCATSHQLVYLPCHRSHMDYVMLSWNLYEHGLMLPHIAAGDNLNTPVLGSMLRRGGAFFMRRSFKGDPLYAQLFKSYLQHISARGHAIEYFIEGGRSRTGRLLSPKPGLLSMTLEGHQQRETPPTALIPVWISYDKLVESHSYQQELAGASKQKESIWSLFRTLKILRSRHGHAALSFGRPILLDQQPDTSTQAISFQTLQHINQAAYINQTALLATVLLANPRTRYQRTALIVQLEELKALLERLPHPPAGIAQEPVQEWLTHASKRRQISCYSNGEIGLTEAQAQEMTFYRNQLHPHLVLPGLYLLLTKRYPNPQTHTLTRLITTLYPYLLNELYLPEDDHSRLLPPLRKTLEKAQLLKRNGKQLMLIENPLAITLMQTAEPILLRYYLTFQLINKGGLLSQEDLINESQRIANLLHRAMGFHSPEYADPKTLQGFIDTLLKQGTVQDNNGLHSTRNTGNLEKRARQILNPTYVQLIEKHLHPR